MKRKKRKRFNYFIPWLGYKTNPFMMYNVRLLKDVIYVEYMLEGVCLLKDILLNIPMSLEFTFLALQNNHSSVLILRDS